MLDRRRAVGEPLGLAEPRSHLGAVRGIAGKDLWLVGSVIDLGVGLVQLFLIQVEKAKMRSFVQPRQALEVEANLLHEGSGYAVVKASITADGKKVTEAEIRYGIVPFPNEALKAAMLETARRVGLPAQFMSAGTSE